MISRYLIEPKIRPVLDPGFRPAVLARRAFEAEATVPVRLALEQADGSVFRFTMPVLDVGHPDWGANGFFLERYVKFLLWAFGGWRVWVDGPSGLAEELAAHYRDTAVGRFDSEIIGERIYDHPVKVEAARDLPVARSTTAPLGRHLDGCRIGFDLGGSDRKVAAVRNGEVVYSEEVVWDPYFQKDPGYHHDGILDSLRRAAEHLPRVDAIGGSAAGVYVNNEVRVASLFRGVSPADFDARIRRVFFTLQERWGGVPFVVVNDGEVTALAGSMSLGENAVLGISMGTSMAGGYVNPEGSLTSWLNELAFAPVDYGPDAPVDEWSGDAGCGVQYFSQQGVDRLARRAGFQFPAKEPLAERLVAVQDALAQGSAAALGVFEAIGTAFGYSIAHYADFYDLRRLLVLGRVTSGPGGDIILQQARDVLNSEFPELARTIDVRLPDEKSRRHGQAVAAASLPLIVQS